MVRYVSIILLKLKKIIYNMAKLTTIEQLNTQLRKAYIVRDWEKIKQIQKEIDFFNYGIK